MQFLSRATDGVRTRDPDLGKVVLYQLSHYRVSCVFPDRNNNYYTICSPYCQQFFQTFLTFLFFLQTCFNLPSPAALSISP